MGEDTDEVEVLKKTVADLEAQLLRQKRTNERLELVIESAPNGIVVADREGKIMMVNHMSEVLFGYSREEFSKLKIEDLIPKRIRDVHRHNRDSFYVKPEVRRMGAGRDLYACRKDGTEFPVEIGLTPLPGWDEPLVLSTIVDISERKESEDALHSYAVELERSNSELENFASFASHDLQEPLRKIKTMGKRLAKMSEGELNEKSLDYLARMINASERMQHLILDLLCFSRVSTGRQPFGIVELNDLVDDVLSTLEFAIEESGSKVDVGKLPAVEVDSSQLRQVFQNLISNSLKFSKPRVPPVIQVTGRVINGDICEIEIKDNGIGFAQEHSNLIFEVFQRLHGRSKFEGTGIGLAICKKIVERHGGSIKAVGKPGEGAEFKILLPRQQKKNRIDSTNKGSHDS